MKLLFLYDTFDVTQPFLCMAKHQTWSLRPSLFGEVIVLMGHGAEMTREICTSTKRCFFVARTSGSSYLVVLLLVCWVSG